MRHIIVAMACLWAHASWANGLDVKAVLLADRRVGIVVKNTSVHRTVLRRIVVTGDKDAATGSRLCRLSFETPNALKPGDQKMLILPGLGLDALVDCLPPEWADTFDLSDIAEISDRRRGCASCRYQLGVWAWNAAWPFDIAYDASVGRRHEYAQRKAYVHFWRER